MGLFCIYRKWYSAVHGAIVRSMIFFYTCMLHLFSVSEEHIPREPGNSPVHNLDEGDDTEAKAEPKQASEGGDEVNWAHSDAPFKL